MAIDLSKFLPLYFEECGESLQLLEHVLLRTLDSKNLRLAVRAAHSIKGSSGAFGFEDVIELAQALEHVLRQAEQQQAGLCPERLALCQEAVVLLRDLLQQRQPGASGGAALTVAAGGRLAACLLESRAG